jgi:hypothetical protein
MMWRFLPNILLSRVRSPLRPVEQRVLDAVLASLEQRSRDLLAQQIESINLVQRDGRESRFYAIRGGKVSWPDRMALPSRRDLRLASVELATGDGAFNADVYLSGGHVASIVFASDPRVVRDPAAAPVTVTHVANLDMAPRAEQHTSTDTAGLPEWLVELGRRHPPLETRRPPATPEERSERLLELGPALPSDYLELLDVSDGLRIDGTIVFGVDAIQRVPMEDGDYGLLGEVAGKGSLAVSLKAPFDLLVFDHESEESRSVGGTLREALETLLDG